MPPEYKNIRVRLETWKELVEIQKQLTKNSGKNFSLDKTIKWLIARLGDAQPGYREREKSGRKKKKSKRS